MEVQTGTEESRDISANDMVSKMSIMEELESFVFCDHIGQMKTVPIQLDYDQMFKPMQTPYHPPPLHYKEKLSQHLAYLRKEGVITDADPRQLYDCVLNVVISD